MMKNIGREGVREAEGRALGVIWIKVTEVRMIQVSCSRNTLDQFDWNC